MPELSQGLIDALVKRQVSSDLEQERQRRYLQSEEPTTNRPTPLSPGLTSLLGGLLDTASTYRFLKRGETEDNSIVKGLSPEAMAATGVATTLGLQGLRKLIGKKWPKAADALAANQGALQLGYGINNLTDLKGHSSSADAYRQALLSELQQDLKRP